MNILEFRNVKKDYCLGETTVSALRGVDLVRRSGRIHRHPRRLGQRQDHAPEYGGSYRRADAGEVVIQGKSVSRMNDNQKAELRNKKLGYIFQNFNLVSVLSALENVMLPLQIRGGRASEIKAEARRRLEEVGLGEFMRHRPDKLSGGQRQRVAIARALITRPSLFLPTNRRPTWTTRPPVRSSI